MSHVDRKDTLRRNAKLQEEVRTPTTRRVGMSTEKGRRRILRLEDGRREKEKARRVKEKEKVKEKARNQERPKPALTLR